MVCPAEARHAEDSRSISFFVPFLCVSSFSFFSLSFSLSISPNLAHSHLCKSILKPRDREGKRRRQEMGNGQRKEIGQMQRICRGEKRLGEKWTNSFLCRWKERYMNGLQRINCEFFSTKISYFF